MAHFFYGMRETASISSRGTSCGTREAVKKFAQGFPIPDRQPAPEHHVSSLGLEQLATETNVVASWFLNRRGLLSQLLCRLAGFLAHRSRAGSQSLGPVMGSSVPFGSPICASRAIKHKSFHWMRESGPISYQELPSIRTPSEEICSGFTVPTVRPDPEGTLLAVTMRTVTPLTACWIR